MEHHRRIEMNTAEGQKPRQSNIDALKLIAVLLVVVSHVAQTVIKTDNPYTPLHAYVLDLSSGVSNIQELLLVLFFYCGKWGNIIFFVISAWFLLDSEEWKKKKWLDMLVEIWVISVVILLCAMPLMKGKIAPMLIIRSLAPTVFGNNWFLTCYLLFYPIHPRLNRWIRGVGRKKLLRTSGILFFLFFILIQLGGDLIFSTPLFWIETYLTWIAIYCVMAYMKFYAKEYADSLRLNLVVLLAGLAGFVGSVLILNELCRQNGFFSGKLYYLNTNNNPFLFIMSLAMFNIARRCRFTNERINKLAGLSMLIYIIHENVILRFYCRPQIINWIYVHYGYGHIAEWVVLLSAAVFILSALAADLYCRTLRRYTVRLSDYLYEHLKLLAGAGK